MTERWQERFFWEVSPGGYLFGAAMVSLSISTYLARCLSLFLFNHCSLFFYWPYFNITCALAPQLLAQGRAGRVAGDGTGTGGLQAHAPVDLDLLPHVVVHPGWSIHCSLLTGSVCSAISSHCGQDAAKVATTRILMSMPRFQPFKVRVGLLLFH